jgi:hypothetical protein
MSTADSYRSYAADCVRQAEGAASPEAKNVLLNMALAWIRLAHQKNAITTRSAPHDLDEAKKASADAAKIDARTAAKVVALGVKHPAAPAAQPAG